MKFYFRFNKTWTSSALKMRPKAPKKVLSPVYSENESIAQYLLLGNEVQAAVLVPRYPQLQNNDKLKVVLGELVYFK